VQCRPGPSSELSGAGERALADVVLVADVLCSADAGVGVARIRRRSHVRDH
jgi:hypothetical protein